MKMGINTKIITRSAFILALAIAVQSVRLPQFVTGPLVNALLFLAAAVIGPVSAVLIGLFTPAIAFAFGIMPLAPVVPLIMAGNAVLAVVYGLLSDKPYMGVVAAAVAKYAVLAGGVYYLLPMLVNITLPPQVISMLTTPQLYTALGGGVLALLALRAFHWLKKENDTLAGQ